MRNIFIIMVTVLSTITVAAFATDSAEQRESLEMETSFVEHFAEEWIDAWNSHDLERILSHYEDDFEMSSPVIRSLYAEPTGKLKGKEAIGAYWALALERNPALHFELRHTLTGSQSITLIYDGVRGLSAEVLIFAPTGKVTAAYAHYE